MAPRKNEKESERNEKNETWKLHDSYKPGVSYNRIVTRSQTPFLRLRNTDSDLDLFCDPSRHHPPGKPHLMETLKGRYGSIPRTMITKSTARYILEDEDLIAEVNSYK